MAQPLHSGGAATHHIAGSAISRLVVQLRQYIQLNSIDMIIEAIVGSTTNMNTRKIKTYKFRS
jgi:hypothetical protein